MPLTAYSRPSSTVWSREYSRFTFDPCTATGLMLAISLASSRPADSADSLSTQTRLLDKHTHKSCDSQVMVHSTLQCYGCVKNLIETSILQNKLSSPPINTQLSSPPNKLSKPPINTQLSSPPNKLSKPPINTQLSSPPNKLSKPPINTQLSSPPNKLSKPPINTQLAVLQIN